MKKNRWTNRQIEILKNEYSYQNWDVLIEKLYPFNKESIIHKAYKMGIKRDSYFWSEKDISFLKENYYILPNDELSKILNRSESAIVTKAGEINILKDNKWSQEEINILYKYYSTKTNIQISKLINRGQECIGMKARELGLKKDKNIGLYDKEDFLKNVKELSKSIGRTPLIQEIIINHWSPSLMTINRYFGGYRKVCDILNLDYNLKIFNNKKSPHKSINNDTCASKAELFITNFFIENNIEYKKEVKYSDYISDDICKTKTCDWIINDSVFVEYFGLMNKPYYALKTEIKIELCKKNNIKLIELYEKSLMKLEEIFKEYIQKSTESVTTGCMPPK